MCYLKLLTKDLVLNASDLPESIPLNLSDINATEEMQVETMQQQQEETHVEQAVSLEVAIEMLVEQAVRTELEIDEITDHPHSEEGREWADHGLFGSGIWEDNDDNAALFPDFWVSNYGLGIYGGRISTIKPEGQSEREAKTWFNNTVESQMPLAQKVLIKVNKEQLYCQMGSIKDTDFYFDGTLRDIQEAKKWVNLPLEEAVKRDLITFPVRRQRGFVEAKQKDPDKTTCDNAYAAQLKASFTDRETLAFKVDLRDTSIPVNLPEEHRENWVQRTALAKFLYVDAIFSVEEREFLKKWLKTDCPVALPELKSRLTSYLKKFFPSSAKNELLTIINGLIQ